MAGLSQDLVALIDEARAAGLTLELKGPKLVISGPKTAEAIALRLLECKPEVLALLKPTYAFPWPEILPDFTRRRVEALSFCAGGPGSPRCPHEASTWVRYGDRPTCLACALHAIEQARVVTAQSPTRKQVPA